MERCARPETSKAEQVGLRMVDLKQVYRYERQSQSYIITYPFFVCPTVILELRDVTTDFSRVEHDQLIHTYLVGKEEKLSKHKDDKSSYYRRISG